MSQQELELPQGWTRTTLKNIISQSIEKFNPLIQPNQIFIGLEHIEEKSGQIIGKGNSEETRSLKTIFHKGDVLYGKLRPYLNKICIPDFNGGDPQSPPILKIINSSRVDPNHPCGNSNSC